MPRPSASHRLVEAVRDLMGKRRAADRDTALGLLALAQRGPDEACLLLRRLASLDLDPGELARREPTVFCELHRRCTTCESKGECALDLADDVAHPAWESRTDSWRDFCPSAATLTELAESGSLGRTREQDCYVSAERPDPAEQMRQRLEALGISMRP
jgi:hypothetical protein